jgi:hypothetical protein
MLSITTKTQATTENTEYLKYPNTSTVMVYKTLLPVVFIFNSSVYLNIQDLLKLGSKVLLSSVF